MTEPIRAILFDKDGTLIDSFGGWIGVNHELFDDLKNRYDGSAGIEDLDRLLGIRGEQVVAGGLVASGTEEQIYQAHHSLLGSSVPEWASFLPEIRDRAEKLFLRNPPPVHPIGKVAETLRQLKSAGYRLGVATSDSYVNAVRDLAELGGNLIEFWATSDRLSQPKPHPESVQAFSKFTGVSAQAIAFVGDSEVDLQSARVAGVGLFVAVRSATCPPEVLAAADAVVESIEEVAGLLRVLNQKAR